MTAPLEISFDEAVLDEIVNLTGQIAVIVGQDGALDRLGRRVNRLCRGALKRFTESDVFDDMKPGTAHVLAYPAGLSADGIVVVKLDRRVTALDAQNAGAAIAAALGKFDMTVLAGAHPRAAELSYGLALRAYAFNDYRTSQSQTPAPHVRFSVSKPEHVASKAAPMAARVEGVFFARDLVSEPANILTTDNYAARLAAMAELGLEVEILEEAELEALGMRALLAVGQGSAMPSKVVVMRWNGGGQEPPLALVGKGVVFDTGGISLKPAAGMEEMTMDMGGSATVCGVMRTLALRRAKANVVGLVGLVENMPDGLAQRPGDVVTSMKGDTIEVINTDAEGRLVLADVLWYAQEHINPCGIIDLATLTGAVIIALGHEHTGVFSNDDTFVKSFLKAAEAEGEGAWRLPLAPAYDVQLKSRIADMANVGGRPAGSITAAQFLQRFVKQDMPWIHLDIAGTATRKAAEGVNPKGPTGWGVRAIDRFIADGYEAKD